MEAYKYRHQLAWFAIDADAIEEPRVELHVRFTRMEAAALINAINLGIRSNEVGEDRHIARVYRDFIDQAAKCIPANNRCKTLTTSDLEASSAYTPSERKGQRVTLTSHVQRPPIVHDIKCQRSQFQAIKRGEKRAEVRKMDRGYKVNDILCQREVTDPSEGPTPSYTGDAILCRITHILPGGQFGIDSAFGVLSIEVIDGPNPDRA